MYLYVNEVLTDNAPKEQMKKILIEQKKTEGHKNLLPGITESR